MTDTYLNIPLANLKLLVIDVAFKTIARNIPAANRGDRKATFAVKVGFGLLGQAIETLRTRAAFGEPGAKAMLEDVMRRCEREQRREAKR